MIRAEVLVLLLLVGAVAVPGAAVGGDVDTHLTATYVLARQAGFSDADARLIAASDQSMDLNATTTALPGTEKTAGSVAEAYGFAGSRATPVGRSAAVELFTSYQERGGTYHSLGTPEEVRASLAALREGVNAPARDERSRLVAVGQYLHTLQDVYFHQHDGVPYTPLIGHLVGGSDPDRVALHFDGALKAFAMTYDVLTKFKTDRRVPEVPHADVLYPSLRDGRRRVLTSAEAEAIRKDDAHTGVYTLTTAIAASYEKEERVVGYGGGTRTVITGYADPKDDVLRANVARAWATLHPSAPKIDPPVGLEAAERLRIDMETHPQMRVVPPRAASAKREPGGISLSMAAAVKLPIAMRLDGITVQDGRVVLAGGAAETKLDAALFMTALRLACERGDPMFSLDPDNGAAWVQEARAAFDVMWKRVRADVEAGRGPRGAGTQLSAPGLTVWSYSLARDYPELWADVAPRSPNLRSRLVFHPRWLRATRLGEILYQADVLLKELAGGIATLPANRDVRAATISRYGSAASRHAGRLLTDAIEGRRAASEPATSYRLWFDLVPETSPPSAFSRPAPVTLPPRWTFGFEASRRDALPSRAERLQDALRSLGMEEYVGGDASAATTLGVDGETIDLSNVYPKMFVRVNDPATGLDIATKEPDPDFAGLAADVNRRTAVYARVYPELRDLTAVFRAYIAAVKVAAARPGMCVAAQTIPLLPAEKVATPLPEFHRSEVAITVARFDTGGEPVLVAVNSVGGGVSLGVKASYGGSVHVVHATSLATQIKEALTLAPKTAPAWKDAAGRSFVALDAESPELVREAAKLRAFRPVTAETVLSGDDERSVSERLRVRGRVWVAAVFGRPALGIAASVVLVVGGMLSGGFAVARLVRLARRLFGRTSA